MEFSVNSIKRSQLYQLLCPLAPVIKAPVIKVFSTFVFLTVSPTPNETTLMPDGVSLRVLLLCTLTSRGS